MNLSTIDLYELVKRNLGTVVYKGSEGIMLRETDNGTIMTDIDNVEKILALTDNLKLAPMITVKNHDTANALAKVKHFESVYPCSQWVYTSTVAPEFDDCDIRILPENLVEYAAKHYSHESNPKEYFYERHSKECLFGIFENGNLAGFIGIHREGSMGMLEILPEYRKKGYAAKLESFLIGYQLKKGQTPFGHVVDGNLPSVSLQLKLGLEKAEKPIIWLCN